MGFTSFIGMLYELKEPFRRFKIYNLAQINLLLTEKHFPPIPSALLPQASEFITEARLIKRKSSRVIKTINYKLDGQLYIPRIGIQSRFNETFQANRLVILKGLAGAGKSAFARNQLITLQENGYQTLAFKADWFAKESIEEVFPNLTQDFADLLSLLGATRQVVILVDGLEKLLEVDTYFAFREFLQICNQLPYIRLIITCRNYAYQQLIFDFHYDFPSYSFIDIPLLSDDELGLVAEHFPTLEDVLSNERYKELLKRPFYLDIAIRNLGIFQTDAVVTELKLRELIWSLVVEKNSEQRATAFEKIAVERATRMSLFVRLDGLDMASLQEMIREGILEVDEQIGDAYRPAHDIYEDIALIRFVERTFQERENSEDFFVHMGGRMPVKRRGFRLWLNDNLIEPDRVASLIRDVFEIEAIERFWVDEVIISILRSDYCETFFERSEELILENDQALLLRFIHLLRISCQEPDEQLIQTVAELDESLYQWIYLRPVGKGWEVLVKFLDKHFEALLLHSPLVLRLLVNDWSKKIRHNLELPVESKSAGRMLLTILDDAKWQFGSRKNEPYSTKDIEKGIELLIGLSSKFESEVRNMIQDASASKKKAEKQYLHQRSSFRSSFESEEEVEKEEEQDYHIRDFQNAVVKFVLSGLGNQAICKVMPELVCQVAKDQWLIDNTAAKDGYESAFDTHIGFGLSGSDLDCFPPGIYKTPIRFLLHFHPIHALRLIVEVINHSTEAYADSPRGRQSNVVDVTVIHNDGTVTSQKGNAALWGIFRGCIEATHYLLESLLMSLESWLLELCQLEGEGADEWLRFYYDYLLRNSTSVAITSVLASVSLAYPHRIGEACFPILRVREFFAWDIRRLVSDRMPMASSDILIPFAQEERIRSNNLPHRNHHLEFLVTKLQFEGNFEKISAIVDEHSKECSDEDTVWKLALNRMDARKYVIDESTGPTEDNQIYLRTSLDEELQDFVDEYERTNETYTRAMGIYDWAIRLYESKNGVDATVEKWSDKLLAYQELAKTKDTTTTWMRDPAYLAAVGIKYFRNELTVDQLNWCIKALINVILERIIGNLNHAPFSSMGIQAAVETIPDVMRLSLEDDIHHSVKQILFLALLNLVTNKSEYPFKAFRNSVWNIDPEYADACLAGMVQFSRQIMQRKWYPSDSVEAQQERKDFLRQQEALAIQVAKNGIVVDLSGLSFDTHSDSFLSFATLIVPVNTDKAHHVELVRKVIQLFLEWHNTDLRKRSPETIDYRVEVEFKRYLARFILLQNELIAKELFGEMLDSIFTSPQSAVHDAVGFVADILEWILIEQDSLELDSFWSVWTVLEDRIRISEKKYCVSYLLLSQKWWNSSVDSWKPLENRSLIMRRLITEFGRYNLAAVVELLSGIGISALMPQGLNWLNAVINDLDNPQQELTKSRVFGYSEKLIQRTYYKYLSEIKQDPQLQRSLLKLLDLQVNAGSSLAFIVRDRLITL